MNKSTWDELIESWINDSQVNPKSGRRAVRTFIQYLSETNQNLKWNESIREKHIHNLKGESFTFRDWLIGKIKSNHGKNDILFNLQKFFDYQILNAQAEGMFSIQNPVCFKWDRFNVIRRNEENSH